VFGLLILRPSPGAMLCHMQNSGKAAVAVALLLATTTSGAVIGIDFGARFLKVRSLCAARKQAPRNCICRLCICTLPGSAAQ